jgi:hypothetical protein
VRGVLGNLRCRGGPPDTEEVSPLVGVTLPGLCGVEEEWGEKDEVGVVGRDLTDEPKATVGVVERGVKIIDLLLVAEDLLVGVCLPEILEDEVLSLLLRFKFPVEPPEELRVVLLVLPLVLPLLHDKSP